MQTDPINYTDGTGQAVIDAASTLTDHAGGVVLDISNLAQFPRGGALDAQAYGASRAYGNYVYGVYLAASGHSLSTALWGANAYAGLSGANYEGSGMVMDPNYPNIPAANVQNIKNGYDAQNSGTTCSAPGR